MSNWKHTVVCVSAYLFVTGISAQPVSASIDYCTFKVKFGSRVIVQFEGTKHNIFNPWRMHHRVIVIVPSMCVSVCYHEIYHLYLIFTSKIKFHRGLFMVFSRFFLCAWLSLKTLCSRVLVSLNSLAWSPSPFSLPSKLSMDKRGSKLNGFYK